MKNLAKNEPFLEECSSESLSEIRKLLNSVINDLPDPLPEILDLFNTEEEKIVALYSAITVCGTIFPKAKVTYGDSDTYPSLMLMILGPPASGKGAMAVVLKLGERIDKELENQFRKDLKEYNKQLKAFRESEAAGNGGKEPVKPLLIMHIMPANSSSSMLLQQVAHNGPEMMGLISETELDVLTTSSNSKHGEMLTTIIRQAFQHEPLRNMRKTNNEIHKSYDTKLAMAFTGTLNQFKKLIPNSEDGSYSRFLILRLAGSWKWKSVRPSKGRESVNKLMEGISDRFLAAWKMTKDYEVEIKFHDHQWDLLDEFGTDQLIRAKEIGEHAGSVVKRHGNMIARIATILTMLEYHNVKSQESLVYCSDEHLMASMLLVNHSLEQSLELYKELPGGALPSKGYSRSFYKQLPAQFTTKEAHQIAGTFTPIPDSRTISRWLSRMVKENILLCERKGHYKKTIDVTSVLSAPESTTASDTTDTTDTSLKLHNI